MFHLGSPSCPSVTCFLTRPLAPLNHLDSLRRLRSVLSGQRTHYHSTAPLVPPPNRRSRGKSAEWQEWWPAGLQSPTVYYYLRAKQLRYLLRHGGR